MGDKTIRIILAILLIIALAFISLKITGYSVSGEPITEVTRIAEPNTTSGLTIIEIAVRSSENVLAIEEHYSNENCSVENWYVNPEVDIYEFSEDGWIWILANSSDNLNLNLFYEINSSCDEFYINGSYYIITDEDVLSQYGIGEENETPVTPPTPSSPSGGGGGGGGGGGTPAVATPTPQLIAQPITQTENREQFDELVEKAENLLGLDESQDLKKFPFITVIVLSLIVVGIIAFLVVSFFRKPKDFEPTIKPKPKDFALKTNNLKN